MLRYGYLLKLLNDKKIMNNYLKLLLKYGLHQLMIRLLLLIKHKII